ncbi:MAG: hypothetical protein HYV63_22155 [Candidatus Schekmanbacteria bacterium]|nr:hypothetical protein [Candidatus Schekmanbacteria bacterium]
MVCGERKRALSECNRDGCLPIWRLFALMLLLAAFALVVPGCDSSSEDDEKTIRVEVDWLVINGTDFLRPDVNNIVNRMVQAFKNHGYTLEVEVSNGISHSTGQLALGPSTTANYNDLFNSSTEFGQLRSQNKNKGDDWHYCIISWAFYFSDQSTVISASGLAQLPGKSFVLGAFAYTPPTSHNQNYMTNTLMHELGHNLGLHHGGFEDANWKPNYNSIMNYRYQFDGFDGNCDAIGEGNGSASGGTAEYSVGRNVNLDETRIFEPDGVCGGGNGIDWSGDGQIDTANFYSGNLDINQQTGQPFDPSLSVLRDFDDWSNLNTTASGRERAEQEVAVCRNVAPGVDLIPDFATWWERYGANFTN